MHVLRSRGRISHLVNGVGLLEAPLDIAKLTMNVDIDVVTKGHALLLVQDRRARLHRNFWIEHRRQELVFHLEQAAGGFRGALGIGHDGGDPLADEADNIVEHVGIVGIHEMILMGRR